MIPPTLTIIKDFDSTCKECRADLVFLKKVHDKPKEKGMLTLGFKLSLYCMLCEHEELLSDVLFGCPPVKPKFTRKKRVPRKS
jgi:predicted metal-binding membrane protein